MKTVSQPSSAVTPTNEAELTFAQLLDAYMPTKVTQNTLVTGTIVAFTHEGVLVDIGTKSESYLSSEEAAAFGLTVGSKATFMIEGEPNEDGQARLSMKSAIGWQAASDLFKSQAAVEVTVKSLVRPRGGNHIAGAVVELKGARGFIPASHLAVRGKAIESLPGTNLTVKVLEEPNLKDRKLLLSNRAAIQEQKDQFFANAKEGQLVTGVVSGFGSKKQLSGEAVEYGAFVDLGNGISGLLHKSEISGDRSAAPSSVLKIGQKLDLVILPGLDAQNQKISLSLKKARSTRFLDSLKEGDLVTGKAVRKADFGWFIELGDGSVDGLLFKWEIAAPQGMDSIHKDEQVTAVVKSLDKAAEKIGLSTKELPAA